MLNTDYKVCTRCIMDTTDPDIEFDEQGVCNHCKNYEKKVVSELIPDELKGSQLTEFVAKVKQKGKGKKYDCIVGISGGVDSSYVALLAKDLGLRTLLVHLDNGWNSDIAVKNVKNIAKNTGFDLYTHVIDWSEFRDIQRSLFAASVVDIELATDHAIKAVIFKVAAKFGVKYLLNGGNVITEAIMPVSWRHTKADKSNLNDIHKKFGETKLRTYPMAGIIKQQLYKRLYGIENVKILNYINFVRKDVIHRLITELEWEEYGGKHHESVFTRFYQGYILPKKFNIDKRRCHYSNLVCAGQLSRDDALERMKLSPYSEEMLKADKEFLIKKLQFTEAEFEAYIKAPRVSHYDYKSDESLIEFLLIMRKKLGMG
ncbi:N-acetyl sugar amidotransferase [Vibrio brasiliensis]|uniref:N-acetyl sugar amidotransferase n=1 Tax=Vibrio brasiliensis TaxID=170652 RepID=UPI0023D7C7E3|nr:N-acetyl sugar amidotransferase [Vibrio brasiliensis]